MKKQTKPKQLSYLLIVFAALGLGAMWVNVFSLFHHGIMAYIAGIPTSLAIVGILSKSANLLPRVQSKRARNAGWFFIGLVLIIEPMVLGMVNWWFMPAELQGRFISYVIAGGAALAVSLVLVLGALVDRSLVPVEEPADKPQSEGEKKGKSAKRKKPDFICRYAGAGCSQKFGSQNAANAHARGCVYKPIAVDLEAKK